jgi:hypothetical protein
MFTVCLVRLTVYVMRRPPDKRKVNQMHSVQNVEVLRLMAAERQAQLRAGAAHGIAGGVAPMRLRVGRRIVGLGRWIAREPAVAGALAR